MFVNRVLTSRRRRRRWGEAGENYIMRNFLN
jgi:hypothetical protein